MHCGLTLCHFWQYKYVPPAAKGLPKVLHSLLGRFSRNECIADGCIATSGIAHGYSAILPDKVIIFIILHMLQLMCNASQATLPIEEITSDLF